MVLLFCFVYKAVKIGYKCIRFFSAKFVDRWLAWSTLQRYTSWFISREITKFCKYIAFNYKYLL